MVLIQHFQECDQKCSTVVSLRVQYLLGNAGYSEQSMNIHPFPWKNVSYVLSHVGIHISHFSFPHCYFHILMLHP